MLAARRGTIPDFSATANSDQLAWTNTTGRSMQVKLQKAAAERFVLLPADNQDSLVAGDYYIAAVSEGQNPSDSSYTGVGTSSGTLTSGEHSEWPILGSQVLPA